MDSCSKFVVPMLRKHDLSNLANDLFTLLSSDSEQFKVLAEAAGLSSANGDLEQIDLSLIDLRGQDLSGLNLLHADFYAAKLTNVDLTSTKLSAINLVEASHIENVKMDDSTREAFDDAYRNYYLHLPLAELEFSVRTDNVLQSVGLRNLWEVAQFKSSELVQLPHLGVRTLEELKHVLSGLGVILVPEDAQSNVELVDRVLAKAVGANRDLKQRLKQQGSKIIAKIAEHDSGARFRVNNLRSVRESNDMTRAEFVKQANVSETTIRKIENSPTDRVILLSTFLKICSALGASADELKFEVYSS